MNDQTPKVGIGVYIRKDDKILVGKRKGEHAPGTWAAPGGKLDFGESWEACARREVAEETGLEIENIQFGNVTNDVFGDKHYVTIQMVADWKAGDPKILEPDKCEKWEWHLWSKIPEPRMLPLQHCIDAGYDPFA